MDKPSLIFLSYSNSHKDQIFIKELLEYFKTLENQGIAEFWNESQIIPGSNKEETILKHLNDAQIILFLISSHFEIRKGINKVLIDRAIQKMNAQTTDVIPIYLRPAFLTNSPLAELSFLPRKPISQWQNRDFAYFEILEQLQERIANNQQKVKKRDETFPVQEILIRLTFHELQLLIFDFNLDQSIILSDELAQTQKIDCLLTNIKQQNRLHELVIYLSRKNKSN